MNSAKNTGLLIWLPAEAEQFFMIDVVFALFKNSDAIDFGH
jgi:hypothetical protein